MRVLILHNRYQEPGGEDVVVDGEIAALGNSGHDVLAVTWSNLGVRSDHPLRAARAFVNAIWNHEAASNVRQAIATCNPHIVHIHNTVAVASPAVVRAAAVPGVGLIHTLHNFRHLCLNGLLLRDRQICTDCVGKLPWRGVTRACYRKSHAASFALACGEVTHRVLRTWDRVHRFIALSEHAKQLHVAAGFEANRIAVKPQTLAADPGVGEHRGDYALFVGRLSAEKGLAVLLRAWREGSLRLPLVIAGAGPERGGIHPGTQVAESVRLLGRVDHSHALDLMRDARILVVPSLWFEGFPLTLLEGLATGCPIIASDIGALREVIRSGESGILVPPGDAQALARAVEELNRNPELRARLSRGARETFEQRFSPERSYEALIRIYQEAHEEAQRSAGARSH